MTEMKITETEAEDIFQDAIKFLSDERDSLSLVCANKYSSIHPKCIPIKMILSKIYIRLSRFDDAKKELDEISFEDFPDEFKEKYFNLLGNYCREKGDYHAAAEWHDRAIQSNPEHTESYIYKGTALARTGDFNSAKEMFIKATGLEGNPEEAYLNLGLVLRAEEKWKEAKAVLEKAIELDHDYETAKKVMSDVVVALELKQKFDGLYYMRPAKIKKKKAEIDTDVLFQNIVDCLCTEKEAQALVYAKKYLSIYPRDIPTGLLMSEILIGFRRFDDAKKQLDEIDCDNISDKYRGMYFNMCGNFFRAKGDYCNAAEWHEKAIQSNAEDIAGYICKGAVLSKAGDFTSAKEIFLKAIDVRGTSGEAYLNLGLVLMAEEKLEEARTALEKAIELDPNCERAKKILNDVVLAIELKRKLDDKLFVF